MDQLNGQARAAEIVERAKRLNLSKAGLCRRASIAPTTLTRWLNGDAEPTLGKLRAIEEVLAAAKERAAE